MDIYICGERYNVLSITGSISNKAERDYGVNIQTTETHDSKQSINYEARDTILLWTDSVGKSEKKNLNKNLTTCFGLSWVLLTKKRNLRKLLGEIANRILSTMYFVLCFASHKWHPKAHRTIQMTI